MKKQIQDLFAGMRWYEAAEYGAMMLMTAATVVDWSVGVWALVLLCVAAAVKCAASRHAGNRALGRGAKAGLWLMMAYYALHAASALWSSHIAEALERAVLMLPMLLFPLFFLLSDMTYLRRRHVSALTWLLAGVLTLRLGLMVCHAVWRHGQGVPWTELTNFNFDPLHHNYLSMYLITAIALLYVELYRHWGDARWRGARWLVALDMVLLGGYMVVVESRSGLIVATLLAGACLLHLAIVGRRWKATAIVVATLAGLLTASYLAAPQLYRRVGYVVDRIEAGTPIDSREVMWPCGMELIKGHELVGWGCDGYWEELRERYRAHDFAEGYEPERYNTHNMYLETVLMTGFVGLAVLLAMVAVPFAAAFVRPRRNLAMALYTVVYAGCMMFEVVFGRQMGLLFVCWWYGVLALNPTGTSVSSRKKKTQ